MNASTNTPPKPTKEPRPLHPDDGDRSLRNPTAKHENRSARLAAKIALKMERW